MTEALSTPDADKFSNLNYRIRLDQTVWRPSDEAKAADIGWIAEGGPGCATCKRASMEPIFAKFIPAMP
ncbi:hypothetical protein [Bradyrhizobium sp. WSM3983]|uniref:hypothetical protein n=1 Tax=Bradyrhizobium sp. WSM3983 TaxID=1038867 RepID=UPI0004002CA8|nr:hypothetical protein [Bradyrhizobium sp. WSM3983]